MRLNSIDALTNKSSIHIAVTPSKKKEEGVKPSSFFL